MRDLILDTLPINFEGRMERKERNEEEKKAQQSAGLEPTSSQVCAPEACAQPMCYNRCSI